jgi:hypothetical protein
MIRVYVTEMGTNVKRYVSILETTTKCLFWFFLPIHLVYLLQF